VRLAVPLPARSHATLAGESPGSALVIAPSARADRRRRPGRTLPGPRMWAAAAHPWLASPPPSGVCVPSLANRSSGPAPDPGPRGRPEIAWPDAGSCVGARSRGDEPGARGPSVCAVSDPLSLVRMRVSARGRRGAARGAGSAATARAAELPAPLVVQLAHRVGQATGPGEGRGQVRGRVEGRGPGEELREAAFRLEVASDHHRVVGLERLRHPVHERARESQRVAHLPHRGTAPGT